MFDNLPNIETTPLTVNTITTSTSKPEKVTVQFDMSGEKLKELQKQDPYCTKIIQLLNSSDPALSKPQEYFIDAHGILFCKISDNDKTFEAVVVPQVVVPFILNQAHDSMGHNGTLRTYHYLKCIFYWKGLCTDVDKYVKNCIKCQMHNLKPQKYAKMHTIVPSFPMEYVAMDLIGRFQPKTFSGHEYALTVIDLLTGFVWCIPLKTKTSEEVLHAYQKHIQSYFGSSCKILSDNRTEFKNKLFAHLADELRIKQIFTRTFHPQANGRIEGFHNFLKTCIWKYVSPALEWDQVVHYACSAYNFLPSEHS